MSFGKDEFSRKLVLGTTNSSEISFGKENFLWNSDFGNRNFSENKFLETEILLSQNQLERRIFSQKQF